MLRTFRIRPVCAVGLIAATVVVGRADAQSTQAAAPPSAAAESDIRAPELAVGVELAQAAIASCSANGFRVAVTVTDAAGNPRVLLATDRARQQAVDSSAAKAYTGCGSRGTHCRG
jgi:hypothetical protein